MSSLHDLQQRRIAGDLARRVMLDLASATGTRTTNPPRSGRCAVGAGDIEPLDRLAASRQLELAAREQTVGYVRAAREAGYSWQDIGTAMELALDGDAQQAGDNVAEAAFTYAAGHPGTKMARSYGRYVTWTCGACDGLIRDHGLCDGPAEDERGHAGNCPRLAATVAAWDAEWDDIEAGMETGQ